MSDVLAGATLRPGAFWLLGLDRIVLRLLASVTAIVGEEGLDLVAGAPLAVVFWLARPTFPVLLEEV